MQQTCVLCGSPFEVTDEDLEFLKRASPVVAGKALLLPPPRHCPDCRVQRRFAQRNERFLHRRKCDLTGRDLVSFYHSESPFKVFEKDAWWSDRWDAADFGRPFDFERPFFEQFEELRKSVPRLGMVATQAEGDAYSAYCVSTKQCYMCISCVVNEDSSYCYQANNSRNCVDSSHLTECELCYECLYCFKLFSSAFSRNCENGSGLFFCEDLRGCSDSIGCKNLVNRKNMIFDEQATAEDVQKLRKKLESHAERVAFEEKFRAFALKLPTRASHLLQCENASGDHLRQCRNTYFSFDSTNLEDCKFVFPTPPAGAKDCRDIHYSPGAELVYDSLSAVRTYGSRFVLHTWDSSDCTYTDECFSSRHLFGCIGLKHEEHCILNKRYTEEEYGALLSKIIEHMRGTGEWGEFFSVALSPFAYNETIAVDEVPLRREEVLRRGWKWAEREEDVPEVKKVIPSGALPESIRQIPDDILEWALTCSATGRPFRIIKRELAFYRQMGLPVPRIHPDERYRKRVGMRNPHKLWDRECAKCSKSIASTYAPDRHEKTFCEGCYLKEVY